MIKGWKTDPLWVKYYDDKKRETEKRLHDKMRINYAIAQQRADEGISMSMLEGIRQQLEVKTR
jgi:hypothetical protein